MTSVMHVAQEVKSGLSRGLREVSGGRAAVGFTWIAHDSVVSAEG